jgi:thiamine pyrophosphokinase
MPHYAIVANGPFLVEEILVEALAGKILVALDGACDKLARLGLKPQIILGDFDSLPEASAAAWGIKKTFAELDFAAEPYLNPQGIKIVPAKNQDFTDLDKAIHYCDQQAAESITLLCATGGRLDHHESVLLSLEMQYKKERPLLLHTEQQTLCYAKDETLVLKGEKGDKCGFIARGKLHSQGLEYECQGHSESFCNTLQGSSAEIRVEGSALIIGPPLLKAQRNFMNKNEVERLELLLRDAKKKVLTPKPQAEALRASSWLNYGLFAATALTASAAILFKWASQTESKPKPR